MDSLRASALCLPTPAHSSLGQPRRLPPALWTTAAVAHTAHRLNNEKEGARIRRRRVTFVTEATGPAEVVDARQAGFLGGVRHRILDRDPLYTAAFRAMLRECSVKCLDHPARSPNLNGHPRPAPARQPRADHPRRELPHEREAAVGADQLQQDREMNTWGGV